MGDNKEFRHTLPTDLKKLIESNSKLKKAWNDLTDLAKNEWICWIISAKKEETRLKRLSRANEDLLKGIRRPCCWPGCPHRRESAKKWFK